MRFFFMLHVLCKPAKLGLCRQNLACLKSSSRHSLLSIRPLCSMLTLRSIQQSSPLLRVGRLQRRCYLHVFLYVCRYIRERQVDVVSSRVALVPHLPCTSTSRTRSFCQYAGVSAEQQGSWRVVGNSGSKGAHAILFANDLVLFMERPNWGVRPEPNTYLTVSLAQKPKSPHERVHAA